MKSPPQRPPPFPRKPGSFEGRGGAVRGRLASYPYMNGSSAKTNGQMNGAFTEDEC